MGHSPAYLWIYKLLKPYALCGIAGFLCAMLLCRTAPSLFLLPLLPALAACGGCFWSGRRASTILPQLSGRGTALFLLAPAGIFWVFFPLFFLLEGGIYLWLPGLILVFALQPVLLLYALMAMALGLLSGWLVWPSQGIFWVLLLLLSLPLPACFYLGRRYAV